MPQVYMTQAEFDAIEFLAGVAHAASEAATDEEFCRDYDLASAKHSAFAKKFYKGKAKQHGKAQVKRVLRQIESEKV